MKINAIVKANETNQTWTAEDDFIIENPKLMIKFSNQPMIGKKTEAVLSFTNPLDVSLTQCFIRLDVSTFIRAIKENVPDVPPRSEFSHTVQITPKKSGIKPCVAAFSSKEMVDVCGSVILKVRS